MQIEHRPFKLLVTGRSGSGKTTYWLRYLIGSQARTKFLFDHQGEIAHRLGVRPAFHLGEIAEAVKTGWVIFDPSRMFPGRLAEAFDFWCEFAFEASVRLPGNKLFGCDELQVLVSTNQVSRELALVLETGRRYGLDVAVISQQPNLIHNRIRNQLTEVVTFAQMDPTSIDWLETAGFRPEKIRCLRPGQFLVRNLTSGSESEGRVF